MTTIEKVYAEAFEDAFYDILRLEADIDLFDMVSIQDETHARARKLRELKHNDKITLVADPDTPEGLDTCNRFYGNKLSSSLYFHEFDPKKMGEADIFKKFRSYFISEYGLDYHSLKGHTQQQRRLLQTLRDPESPFAFAFAYFTFNAMIRYVRSYPAPAMPDLVPTAARAMDTFNLFYQHAWQEAQPDVEIDIKNRDGTINLERASAKKYFDKHGHPPFPPPRYTAIKDIFYPHREIFDYEPDLLHPKHALFREMKRIVESDWAHKRALREQQELNNPVPLQKPQEGEIISLPVTRPYGGPKQR